MRWLKNKGICFLVLAFLVMRNGLTVSAAEEEYTYTVRLYAGNQGRLLGAGSMSHQNLQGSLSQTDIL
jgi:hypothetical protein